MIANKCLKYKQMCQDNKYYLHYTQLRIKWAKLTNQYIKLCIPSADSISYENTEHTSGGNQLFQLRDS